MKVVTARERYHDRRARRLLDELLDHRAVLAARAGTLVVPAGGRTWIRVVDTEDADAWLIAWDPSSFVPAHDHGGSHGALHVLAGELVESYRARRDDGSMRVRHLRAGRTIVIPGDRVHDVANAGGQRAYSLHVYSPRLTTMTFASEPFLRDSAESEPISA